MEEIASPCDEEDGSGICSIEEEADDATDDTGRFGVRVTCWSGIVKISPGEEEAEREGDENAIPPKPGEENGIPGVGAAKEGSEDGGGSLDIFCSACKGPDDAGEASTCSAEEAFIGSAGSEKG